MPLNEIASGFVTMDGSEDNLFSVVGTIDKHFQSWIKLNEMAAGDTIRVRVYDRNDGISYWKFDGDVNDYAGNNNGTITYHPNLKSLYKFEQNVNATVGNNGTVTGNSAFLSGKEGAAFSFDGSSYILASDTGLSAVNAAWSVSCWINPTSFAAQRSIYAWGSNVANQGINIYANVSGKIVIDNVTGALLTSIGTTTAATPTFITVTYDGTTLRLYINGVQDSTATPAALNITLAGATGQHIGTSVSNTNNFLGWIDELRNYNVSLSTNQVSALYMVGKYGQSHTFDGGEFINLGNILNFERTQIFSVSLWLKTTTIGFQFIIAKFANVATGWLFGQTGNNALFQLANSNNVNDFTATSDFVINDGNWHHIVVTYDGSSTANGVKFYKDGIPGITQIGRNNLTASILNSAPAVIGSLDAVPNSPLTGQLDDLRVYNRILTSADVTDLFNNPKEMKNIYYDKTYAGPQTQPSLYVPFVQSKQYTVSLQQTAGNYYKTIGWTRYEQT